MKRFKFLKEETNRWYVVLPEWEGPKDDLEMVLGADTMLDIFAQGEFEVNLVMSTEDFVTKHAELTLTREEGDGGWYDIKTEFSEFECWLCKVTKFVFGHLPEKIYIQRS